MNFSRVSIRIQPVSDLSVDRVPIPLPFSGRMRLLIRTRTRLITEKVPRIARYNYAVRKCALLTVSA